MSESLKVTLAYPYTGPDGVEHRADRTVSLPVEVAQHLLWSGRARAAETPTTKATKATSATEKKE